MLALGGCGKGWLIERPPQIDYGKSPLPMR